jgi:hypothetical protein
MSKFTDGLWRDLAREHGAALTHADRPEPGRARVPRPRVLAGSTLALAGAGAALTLVLTATGSTPAYAVTKNGDGSVLVTINQTQALPQANQKLTAMGIREQITIYVAAGAAAVSGPVTCTPAQGVSGPPVKVLVGTNGTEVIGSGNTGAGTWHLAACHLTGDTGSGNAGSGNTGNTGAG